MAGHHLPELPPHDQIDGTGAEARGQHAVVGRRRSAALQVPEHDGAGFLAGQGFEVMGQLVPDAAETLDVFAGGRLDDRALPALGLGALGDDNDRELGAELVARAHALGDLLDIVGNLGDEDDVGATAEARVQGDPAGVAAHDLDDHDAAMGGGRGVQSIDGLGREAGGGVEAEAVHRADDVVVDRLGHADDGHAELVEVLRQAERAVTTDGDDRVDPGLLEDLDAAIAVVLRAVRGHVRLEERVAAIDGAQDGPAHAEDAGDILVRQRKGTIDFDQAIERVRNAVALEAAVDGRLDDGTDDCVEAGRVAPAGEYADSVNFVHGIPGQNARRAGRVYQWGQTLAGVGPCHPP